MSVKVLEESDLLGYDLSSPKGISKFINDHPNSKIDLDHLSVESTDRSLTVTSVQSTGWYDKRTFNNKGKMINQSIGK